MSSIQPIKEHELRGVPHVGLEQWRVLRAVVDAGGYAQAAEQLHKSQSTVTYAVQKLERLLGVKVFELHGRKAVLTPEGHLLYRRAGALLEEAFTLENAARRLAEGWEPEIRLAVASAFPTWLLLGCLGRFATERPATRIELLETVLGGTEEALLNHRVDLAISSVVPPGLLGDPLLELDFIAVAAREHPLHAIGRPLTHHDLRKHRQIVIRDSGQLRTRSSGWLGAEARWTVSYKATSIRAVCMGLGFAWFPRSMIRDELATGVLKPLSLREGGERHVTLYLVVPNRDLAGRGTCRLVELLRESVQLG
ncbi:MAG: LysR family transcriptional regulator [Rhodanobacteraceae bacterium]